MNDNTFKTGQFVMRESQQSGSSLAGFNRRVCGVPYADAFRYDHERQDSNLRGGWNLADDLIRKGTIFYVHNFHRSHGDCPTGNAFQYGGFWVCDTCGAKGFDSEWWKIRVFMDGNAWCCIGVGFEDLQESENYAFGDTRDEAISNYGDIMAVDNSCAMGD